MPESRAEQQRKTATRAAKQAEISDLRERLASIDAAPDRDAILDLDPALVDMCADVERDWFPVERLREIIRGRISRRIARIEHPARRERSSGPFSATGDGNRQIRASGPHH